MTIPAHMTESDVVAALKAGNQRIFRCLVERYHRSMVGVASRYARRPAVAEEIVQETWLAILKGLDGFQGRSSLRSWMFSIVSNRARTRATREARQIPASALGDEDDGQRRIDASRFDGRGMWKIPPRRWDVDTPEAIAGRHELVVRVQAAIDALPPRQRAVITLRDIEHLDASEVCELLELTPGNQRVLLHRARTAVRAAIAEHLEERRC